MRLVIFEAAAVSLVDISGRFRELIQCGLTVATR